MGIQKNKRSILIAVITVATCLLSYYINETFEARETVYTSLFYIPVIITGLWYYRHTIAISVLLAIYFNVLEYIELHKLVIDQLMRGLILILGAVVLYYLGGKLNQRNQELESSKNQLAIEKESLRIMLHSIGDGVISCDMTGNVTYLNEVAQKLTGWFDESAFGKPFYEVFSIINEFTREKSEDPIQKVLKTGQIIELANHTVLIAKDGTERSIADSAAPIKDQYGNISGVILVFRDVTDEKIKQNEIEYLSLHDQLTGLGNRRYLEDKLKELDQKEYLPISVIMGDANGLKLTNDAFGHSLGDELLKKAADVLRTVCRNDDIICRYGGDEYVVVLPKTNEEEAALITKRLRSACADIEIGPVKFSISLGYATKKNENEDLAEMIKAAEDYMYKNKLFESPSTRGNIIHNIMNTLRENSYKEREQTLHSGFYCEKVAKAFELNEPDIEKYKTACMVHDIGKISVPQEVLNKEEKLTDEEWSMIKKHPEIGYRILKAVPEFADIAELVLAHHERWDGTGYPKGLKGEEIPYIARVITIADSFDAMTSNRAYRKAKSREEAIQEIERCSGKQFDPIIAKVFIEKVLSD